MGLWLWWAVLSIEVFGLFWCLMGVTKMDWHKFEQRCAIKLCMKLGESSVVAYEKFQRAYGKRFLSRAQVFRWHKSFVEGREQAEEDPLAGSPSTSETDDNVKRLRSLVSSDRRLTLRTTSNELSLNRFTVLQILRLNLVMRKRPLSHVSFHQ
jgi:hypothetical protein